MHYSTTKKKDKKKYQAGSDHEYVSKDKNGEEVQEEGSEVDTMEEEREEQSGNGEEKDITLNASSSADEEVINDYIIHKGNKVTTVSISLSTDVDILDFINSHSKLQEAIPHALTITVNWYWNGNWTYRQQYHFLKTHLGKVIVYGGSIQSTSPEYFAEYQKSLSSSSKEEEIVSVKETVPSEGKPEKGTVEVTHYFDDKGRLVITGKNGENIKSPDAFRYIQQKVKEGNPDFEKYKDKVYSSDLEKDPGLKPPVFVLTREGKDPLIIPYVFNDKKAEPEQTEEDAEIDKLIAEYFASEEESESYETERKEAVPAKVEEKDTVQKAIEFFREYAGDMGEIGISFIPVVSEIYDLVTAITGKSPLTGEELDPLDRLLTLGGLLPVIPGSLLRKGKGLLEFFISKSEALEIINRNLEDAIKYLEDSWDKVEEYFGIKKKEVPEKEEAAAGGAVVPEEQKEKDWLEYHEKTPGQTGKQKHGHTKERHVGTGNQKVDDQKIVKRFDDARSANKYLPSASSYYTDIAKAQEEISKAIKSQRDKINAWLRDPSSMDADFIIPSSNVGRGILKTDYNYAINNGLDPHDFIKDYNNVSVVIRKNPNGKGYYILTSYPTDKPTSSFAKH